MYQINALWITCRIFFICVSSSQDSKDRCVDLDQVIGPTGNSVVMINNISYFDL